MGVDPAARERGPGGGKGEQVQGVRRDSRFRGEKGAGPG